VTRGRFFEQASRYDFARTQQCWDSDWGGPQIFWTAKGSNTAMSQSLS